MPGERGCELDTALIFLLFQNSGSRIIKYDPKVPLVFAGKLAQHQVAGLRAGLPIDMARGIAWGVLANPVEIMAPSGNKGFELADDHRQSFHEILRLLDRWQDDNFTLQWDHSSLPEKREWKARRDSELSLLIGAAPFETQIHIFKSLLSWAEPRKVKRTSQDRVC